MVLGCVLIALGASMIYVPAGVITAGLLLVAGAVLDGYDDTDEEGKARDEEKEHICNLTGEVRRNG